MKKYKNNSWYSIIIAIFTMWIMISFTIWVFTMISRQSKDIKWMEFYNKSYLWAEAWVELALLESKKSNYSINVDNFNTKQAIWESLIEDSNYSISWTTTTLENESLYWSEFKVIPLFATKNNNWTLTKINTSNIILSSTWSEHIVWNVLSDNGWITWTWNILINSNWITKNINENLKESIDTNSNLEKYIENNSNNFLLLQNTSENEIFFTLNGTWTNTEFTKPSTQISSTCDIRGYKQTINVDVNTSSMYDLLKYSIFSTTN